MSPGAMGSHRKRRNRKLRKAVVTRLRQEGTLSRRELLDWLRIDDRLGASKRSVARALDKLIRKGRIVVEGSRAGARFRCAQPL